jgi:Porin subfamily
MNARVLFLGCAAALLVASGAQAGDAVVAEDPLQANPVNVCDAYGTGYTQIPGTGTCVRMSGQVRYDKSIHDGPGSHRARGSNGFTMGIETITE